MRKTKVISCLLAATLIAASLAGCGDSAAATTDEASPQQEEKAPQEQKGTMAKVVSLEGDSITVILADVPDEMGGGTPPTNRTPPEGENGPTGASGAAIEGNEDQTGQPGQSGDPQRGGKEIQFTGEEVTYTLSDEITVTSGMGDSQTEMDLSEIAADSVISFTTDTNEKGSDVIVSIRVMQ